ncbi:MAG: DNA mismatch repair endonuclease MutL [Ruminococcus sp.]|nr:DNA mismatch repair endonuclease MutL [Ruminococcus sp.]
MQKIQVLDQITIDKIAAGEVIERPSSIVKELVENALDADASSVTVEIEDGGISLIRITDDGSGIQGEDIRNAFLRHSTSKIRDVDDLLQISSLGFRGEALSSIAAVARVELLTKTRDAVAGSRYVIEGGQEHSLEEAAVADGTTFIVRQLFYNVPARRKFLKTAMTEAGHVQDLLMRLALSHPNVAFRFISNGQEKLCTSGSGRLDEVIYSIYGREVTASLLEMDFEKYGFGISGFIGRPVITRGNRNFETFFVNGRYVKSPVISRAVEDAYKDFSMQHKFPFVVLHFQVDPATVDINVHPTKMELRFQRQQDVYDVVFEGIHNRLLMPELIEEVEAPKPQDGVGQTANIREKGLPRGRAREKNLQASSPKIGTASPFLLKPCGTDLVLREESNYEAGGVDGIPSGGAVGGLANAAMVENVSVPGKGQERDEEYFIKKMRERVLAYHNRVSSAETSGAGQIFKPDMQEERIRQAAALAKQDELEGRENAFKRPDASEGQAVTSEQLNLFDEHFLKRETRAEYKLVGQVFDTYWLVEFHEQLYIIDQHAAHERVLYEKTLRGMKNREYTSQYVSPPVILTLTMQEEETLKTHMEAFSRIGFEIEPFGGKEYAVRAVPDNLFHIAKKELLMEMLDALTDGLSTHMSPELIDEKIASMSCKAAVKGNSRLSAREADALIGELLTLENPYHCPHGRPTIISMSKRELEKKFKRIV